MQFGAQGDWLFHLPYTAQDHPARSFSLITWRWSSGGLGAFAGPAGVSSGAHRRRFALLLLVYALITHVTQDLAERRSAFLLVALSSGFAWLAVMAGYLGTSDLVIPESNTLYSLHLNPHFPAAMALMLGLLIPFARRELDLRKWLLALALVSLALAIVQPFAVVTVYLTLGVTLALRGWRDRRIEWPMVWIACIAGLATLPLLVYTVWITQADPVLRGWMAQNVTPSPAVWDYALGYGLVLVLAVPDVSRRRGGAATLICCCWPGLA